ncbi:MAG: type II toxin-antitoxin system PemK/MazF family toxin [Deltaproteobacteria bacterium]|nr:type II toxin-antitoxin system PemK/MazF family toxin [Deltaproteobacteria bacterium]MBI2990585.1 type II toxin-antitoxin system PemK/MazF family toxin [Deltaproteobacteria bacterium]
MPPGKATYRQRDILLTRFPFSDLVGSKVRPVLVLSNDGYNRRFSDVLICAITSSPRTHEYAASLTAKDLDQGILKVESKVRADTITSIEQEIVLKKIGRVKKEKYRQVVNLVQKLIDAR